MLEHASDISTRYITDNVTKKFIEIFNPSVLSEMRQNVFSAGRYSQTQDNVNADLIPFLISVLDSISEELVKNANDDLEKSIDDLVIN
jgi:flagellar hook-basal body complex protein FliE